MGRLYDIGAKILPFLLILSALALAGLWNVDEVRLFAVTQLGERELQRVEGAVDDPSDEVATQACYYVMKGGEGAAPSFLMDALQEHPKRAFACLDKVAGTSSTSSTPPDDDEAGEADGEDESSEADAEGGDEPEQVQSVEEQRRYDPFVDGVELVPRHELVAAQLGKRWMSDLIEGRAKSCQMAKHARRAMQRARFDATYHLLACAVAADSENVRECCVEELGGEEAFAELLEQPALVPLFQAADDFAALVGAGFASVPVASKVAAQESEDDQDAEESDSSEDDDQAEEAGDEPQRFGPRQADVQDWVVEVGCRFHFDSPSERRTVEAFAPLIESDGCAPTDPPWSGFYDEQSWSMMCTGLYDYRREELGESPREAICASLEGASVSQAATATGVLVDAAVSVARQTQGVSSEFRGVGAADSGATFQRSRPNAHRRDTSGFNGMLRQFIGF
jgi:hypothetical protein